MTVTVVTYFVTKKEGQKFDFLFLGGTVIFCHKSFFCAKILSMRNGPWVTMVMQCFVVIFGTEID